MGFGRDRCIEFHQAIAGGEQEQLQFRVDLQFAPDVGQVVEHGLAAQVQMFAHLHGGLPRREQAQDVELPGGQVVQRIAAVSGLAGQGMGHVG